MTEVIVADQAHSVLNGVDSYLPDLNTRVKSWRATLETMPIVPEREMKVAMTRVKQLIQALPATKEPLAPHDAVVAKGAMTLLRSAFQDVISLHQQNAVKFKELRDQFINEEIILLGQLETLLRQAQSVEEEQEIVYDNLEDLQERIADSHMNIAKFKHEVKKEYRSLSEHQGLFMAAAPTLGHHHVESLEHEIKLHQADIETWQNSADACEASQNDRRASLGQLSTTKTQVTNHKSSVSAGRDRCDEILEVALPKLQSLQSAVKILGPFTADECRLETVDVVELYRSVLTAVQKAMITHSVVGEGSEVVRRVGALPFASELTKNLTDLDHAIKTVY